MVEPFWAPLKTKCYYQNTFISHDQVYIGVATWIEDFSNRRGIHSSLGSRHRMRTASSCLDNSCIMKPNNSHEGPLSSLLRIAQMCSYDAYHRTSVRRSS